MYSLDLLVHKTLVHIGDAIAIINQAELMMQLKNAMIQSS